MTTDPHDSTAHVSPPAHNPGFRLQDGEEVILALRRTSWNATLDQVVTLGLYISWWNVAWFVVTDRRLIAKKGILDRTEVVPAAD